ncbi:restriction endonuclease subunit S [Vagococcus fluvialis]|uniref:restriction endonuclease subunit S n=1 Tax=Vagococcus fluvialis TaxID=2738 RepID=UPI0037D1843E
MINKQKKEPVIRFNGFTDTWEQRKLGELGKTQSGIGFPDIEQGGTEGIPFFKVSDMNNEGNENEMRTANNYVSKEQIERKKWKLIEKVPAVIFAKVGAAIMLNRKRIVRSSFLIDNNTMAYIFDASWNAEFGKTLFETISLPKFAQVGALPSYNSSDIETIHINFPQNEEQKKIGVFFHQIDETITLRERELELLKKQKKSLLQKMFPKKGNRVPEMRFAEFTDDWEHRKLGEMFSERSERNAEGELISVTINSGVLKASDLDRKDNSSHDKSNYKQVKMGDIAYNSMRMWQGASGYSPYNGILSPAYTVIIPKEGIDSKFFAYNFKRYEMIQVFKRNSQGLTSDTWNLKFPTLKSITVTVPCGEEQKQISKFFQKLDETIMLKERELETLKNMKKSFLQKMFV